MYRIQTPIPTPPRSPRINLSSDKNITQELADIVPLPTATTSKTSHSKRRISIDQVLYEIVPQLAEKATDDLIENNLKPFIAATIIEDRDTFRSEVPDLFSQEFNAQAPKIIEELLKNCVQSNVIQVHPTTTTSTETTLSADLQQQLYLKMKISLQYQANEPVLWEVLKRKFEKSSTSNTSCMDDDIYSHRHDDHQEDNAPPEGEKRVKRHKASKSSKSARGSSSKHSAKDSTTYVSKQQQQQEEWDAQVEEIVIDDDEATLNDMLSNQFKNAEEYVYNLEQTTKFMKNHIVWESRQEDIRHTCIIKGVDLVKGQSMVLSQSIEGHDEGMVLRMIEHLTEEDQIERLKKEELKGLSQDNPSGSVICQAVPDVTEDDSNLQMVNLSLGDGVNKSNEDSDDVNKSDENSDDVIKDDKEIVQCEGATRHATRSRRDNLGDNEDKPRIETALRRDWFKENYTPQDPMYLTGMLASYYCYEGPTQNWLMTLAASTPTVKIVKDFDELTRPPIYCSGTS
ncbi:hypothetical protein Tco_0853429 [Tanacetum coccineum]